MLDIVQLIIGGGTGATAALLTVYFMTRENTKDLRELKEDCRECREKVHRRLDAGTGEFSELRDSLNETQIDLLKTVQNVADDNSRYREKVHEQYVTEATFKDRVLAVIYSVCNSCRKGGS